MNRTKRIAVIPLGLSLGLFFVITFVLCVLYGLATPAEPMHRLLPMLLPGFTWISWPSFLLGLAWAFGYGWYVALIFAPLHNFFAARGEEQGSA
jgi:hypothetical protein